MKEPAVPNQVRAIRSTAVVSFADRSPAGRAHCEALHWVGRLYAQKPCLADLAEFDIWRAEGLNKEAFIRATSRFLDREAVAEGRSIRTQAGADPDWIAALVAVPAPDEPRGV